MASNRMKAASKAAGIHLLISLAVAVSAAVLVVGVWYPGPFRDVAGGLALLLLVAGVDVVCGPLLTLVLFNPVKSRKELRLDLGLAALLQLLALAYGLWTVWMARPIYLVHEIDRFKVIASPQLEENSLQALSADLRPRFFSGPKTVTTRPLTRQEREAVLFESLKGGRDLAERPEYYAPYDKAAGLNALKPARPLQGFLDKVPGQLAEANALAKAKGLDVSGLRYLPVIARQDWVAVMNNDGDIVYFLKGDGF